MDNGICQSRYVASGSSAAAACASSSDSSSSAYSTASPVTSHSAGSRASCSRADASRARNTNPKASPPLVELRQRRNRPRAKRQAATLIDARRERSEQSDDSDLAHEPISWARNTAGHDDADDLIQAVIQENDAIIGSQFCAETLRKSLKKNYVLASPPQHFSMNLNSRASLSQMRSDVAAPRAPLIRGDVERARCDRSRRASSIEDGRLSSETGHLLNGMQKLAGPRARLLDANSTSQGHTHSRYNTLATPTRRKANLGATNQSGERLQKTTTATHELSSQFGGSARAAKKSNTFGAIPTRRDEPSSSFARPATQACADDVMSQAAAPESNEASWGPEDVTREKAQNYPGASLFALAPNDSCSSQVRHKRRPRATDQRGDESTSVSGVASSLSSASNCFNCRQCQAAASKNEMDFHSNSSSKPRTTLDASSTHSRSHLTCSKVQRPQINTHQPQRQRKRIGSPHRRATSTRIARVPTKNHNHKSGPNGRSAAGGELGGFRCLGRPARLVPVPPPVVPLHKERELRDATAKDLIRPFDNNDDGEHVCMITGASAGAAVELRLDAWRGAPRAACVTSTRLVASEWEDLQPGKANEQNAHHHYSGDDKKPAAHADGAPPPPESSWDVVKRVGRRFLSNLLPVHMQLEPAASRHDPIKQQQQREQDLTMTSNINRPHHEMRMRFLMSGPPLSQKYDASLSASDCQLEPLYDTPAELDQIELSLTSQSFESPESALASASSGMLSFDDEELMLFDVKFQREPTQVQIQTQTPTLPALRAPEAVRRALRPNMPPPPPPPPATHAASSVRSPAQASLSLGAAGRDCAEEAAETCADSARNTRSQNSKRVDVETSSQISVASTIDSEKSTINSSESTLISDEQGEAEKVEETHKTSLRNQSYEKLSSEIRQAQANLIGQLIDRTQKLSPTQARVETKAGSQTQAQPQILRNSEQGEEQLEDCENHNCEQQGASQEHTRMGANQSAASATKPTECGVARRPVNRFYRRKSSDAKAQSEPAQEAHSHQLKKYHKFQQNLHEIISRRLHHHAELSHHKENDKKRLQRNSLATLVNTQNTNICSTNPVAGDNSLLAAPQETKQAGTSSSLMSMARKSTAGTLSQSKDLLELGELIEQSHVFIHPRAQIEQHEQFWHDCLQAKLSKRQQCEPDEPATPPTVSSDNDATRRQHSQKLIDIRQVAHEATRDDDDDEQARVNEVASETSETTTVIPIRATPATRTLSGKRRDFLANRTTINLINSNTTPLATCAKDESSPTTATPTTPSLLEILTPSSEQHEALGQTREQRKSVASSCSISSNADECYELTNGADASLSSSEVASASPLKYTPILDLTSSRSESQQSGRSFDELSSGGASSSIKIITNCDNEQATIRRCLSPISISMLMTQSNANNGDPTQVASSSSNQVNVSTEQAASCLIKKDLAQVQQENIIISACEPLVVTTSDIPETVLVEQLATSTSQEDNNNDQSAEDSPKKSIFDGASKDEILEYLEDARERVPEVLMAADDVMVLSENELIVVDQLLPGAPATPISIVELRQQETTTLTSKTSSQLVAEQTSKRQPESLIRGNSIGDIKVSKSSESESPANSLSTCAHNNKEQLDCAAGERPTMGANSESHRNESSRSPSGNHTSASGTFECGAQSVGYKSLAPTNASSTSAATATLSTSSDEFEDSARIKRANSSAFESEKRVQLRQVDETSSHKQASRVALEQNQDIANQVVVILGEKKEATTLRNEPTVDENNNRAHHDKSKLSSGCAPSDFSPAAADTDANNSNNHTNTSKIADLARTNQRSANNTNRFDCYLLGRQQQQQQQRFRQDSAGAQQAVLPLLMRRRQRAGSDSPAFGLGADQQRQQSHGLASFELGKMEFQCPDCDQFLNLSELPMGEQNGGGGSSSSLGAEDERVKVNRVRDLLGDLQKLQQSSSDSRATPGDDAWNCESYNHFVCSPFNRMGYNQTGFLQLQQQQQMYADQLERAYVAAINGLPLCKMCEKKRSERKEIIWEFVETELKYGRDLKIIHDEFLRPMQIAGLLSKEQISGIFLNLDELRVANKRFAAKLEQALEKSQKISDFDLNSICLGKIFLDCSEMLHSFESYCVRQASAACLLARLAKEKDLLRIFLRVSQMENTLLRRMNLAAFLVVPVQRVTRYPLLLQRLYKVTAYHHKDREALRDAQLRVELHLDHINRQTKDLNCGATNKIWRRISNLSGPISMTSSANIHQAAAANTTTTTTTTTMTSMTTMTSPQNNTNNNNGLSISNCSNLNGATSMQDNCALATTTSTHLAPAAASLSCGTSSVHAHSAAQKRAQMMNNDDIDCIKLRKAALDALQWDRDETHFIHAGVLHFSQLNEFLVKQKMKSLRYMAANAMLIVRGRPNCKYRPDLIKPNLDNRLMTPLQQGGAADSGNGIKEAVLLLFREKNGRFVLSHEPLSLSNCVLSNDCSQFNSECPAPLAAPTISSSQPQISAAPANEANNNNNNNNNNNDNDNVKTGSNMTINNNSNNNSHQSSNINKTARLLGSIGNASMSSGGGSTDSGSHVTSTMASFSLQSNGSSRSASVESNNGSCSTSSSSSSSSSAQISMVSGTKTPSIHAQAYPSLPQRTGSAGSCAIGLSQVIYVSNNSCNSNNNNHNHNNDNQRITNSYNEGSSPCAPPKINSSRKGSDNNIINNNNNSSVKSSSSSTSTSTSSSSSSSTPRTINSFGVPSIGHIHESVVPSYSQHLHHFHNHHQQVYGVYEESFELHERLTKESLLIRADTPLKTRYWLQMLRYHAKDLGQWRQRRSGLANIMMMRREHSA